VSVGVAVTACKRERLNLFGIGKEYLLFNYVLKDGVASSGYEEKRELSRRNA
jgi:hypothetical protein